MREKMSGRMREQDSKTPYDFYFLNLRKPAKFSCLIASELMFSLSISEFMSPRNILINFRIYATKEKNPK